MIVEINNYEKIDIFLMLRNDVSYLFFLLK